MFQDTPQTLDQYMGDHLKGSTHVDFLKAVEEGLKISRHGKDIVVVTDLRNEKQYYVQSLPTGGYQLHYYKPLKNTKTHLGTDVSYIGRGFLLEDPISDRDSESLYLSTHAGFVCVNTISISASANDPRVLLEAKPKPKQKDVERRYYKIYLPSFS